MSIRISPAIGGAVIEGIGGIWKPKKDFRPYILSRDGNKIYFDSARSEVRPYSTGVGLGWATVYTQFPALGDLSIETRVWVEDTTGFVRYEMFAVEDGELEEVMWPSPLEHEAEDGYTVLPFMQGCLLKNYADGADRFDGPQNPCSRGMTMRMYSQYNGNGGYLAIVDTFFDCGLMIDAKPGKAVSVSPRWMAQMGKLSRERRMHIRMIPAGGDYNDAALLYRQYIKEQGGLVTLKEKIARQPRVAEYVGIPVCHTDCYLHMVPESAYYDHEHPEKNDQLTTFDETAAKLTRLHDLGVEKLCMHLDGWQRRGYDNLHPDTLPPCEKAGGWEGFARLRRTCHELGYYFGIHDQYRDYYFDCDSFDMENVAIRRDGTYEEASQWYGGRQTMMCAKQSPDYVRRNFNEMERHDCKPDNAYLDVFSVVDLDECFNPAHKMTREECAQYRAKCFADVSSRGIVLQSEEIVDWAAPYLDFIHHAPFALKENWENFDTIGIGIPLQFLVYHDCVIMPYFAQFGGFGIPKTLDGSLLSMLYGCATYISDKATEADVAKMKTITDWQKKVQFRPMLRHTFLEGKKQKCEFEGGYACTVDFEAGTYELTYGKDE